MRLVDMKMIAFGELRVRLIQKCERGCVGDLRARSASGEDLNDKV